MGTSVSCFTMMQGCYNCKQDQNSNVLVNGYITMPLQFSWRSSTSMLKSNLEIIILGVENKGKLKTPPIILSV